MPSPRGASVSSAGTSHSIPKAGRAKSCTSCRQVKLRCDVRETYPDACTRCKDRDVDCKMDAAFKRVPARGRLEEVTKKLDHLQKALGHVEPKKVHRVAVPQNAPTPPIPVDDHPTSLAEISVLARPEASMQFASCFGLESHTTDVQFKQLGDVVLTSETISDLFTHYYQFRHHHLPIVNTDITIESLYLSSSILFWTIIAVSSHSNPRYPDLHQTLAAPYKALVSNVLVRPVTSLKTIQAILLLCLWPFPVRHQHDEPSLNYCGLAISAALQMGLHRPCHPGEYKASDKTGSKKDAVMTWMACFQICTLLSSNLGLPPTLGSDVHLETIHSMCRTTDIPRNFAAQTEIQRHVARCISILERQTDTRSRCSITQMLDQDLDSMKVLFQDGWCDEVEFNFLAAKLYLYALCFAPHSNRSSSFQGAHGSSDIEVTAHVLLRGGLTTVIRLVRTFSAFYNLQRHEGDFQPVELDDFDHRTFYPKVYFRTLFFAVCFLLFFLSTNSNTTPEDKHSVQVQVDAIHQIFSNGSATEEHKHAAKSIQALRKAINLEIGSPENVVQSRLGASIYFNALRTTKKLKVKKVRRAEHSDLGPVRDDGAHHQASNGLDLEPALETTPQPYLWEFPWNMFDNPLLEVPDLDMDSFL